jgi:uncharacterized phage protein (TIGR02218 family)
MRDISSAFFAALQQDTIDVTELITLSTRVQDWRWTTSNQEIVSSGDIYNPFPGQTFKGIEDGVDLGIATIEFFMSNSGGVFDEILQSSGLEGATIEIKRVLVSTPDLDAMNIYKGQIGDYSYNRSNISGQARNIFGGVNIQWPYYTYMDACTWRFGGTGCAFDTSAITITTSLQAVSGSRIQVLAGSGDFIGSGYLNGHFDRGRVTFTTGQNSGQIRTVRAHTGDLFNLSHQLPFFTDSGDLIEVFAGCRKRLVADCQSKYNNTSNFLGFPWIPRQENAF